MPNNRNKKNKKKQAAKRAAATRAPPGRVVLTRSYVRSRPAAHAAFEAAVRNPFSAYALGCRVPDAYSFPTICYHLQTTLNITPSSNNDFFIALLPSPCFSYCFANGQSTGPIVFGASPFASNSFAGYLTSPNSLAQYICNFRVVAWGVRLVLKDTQTNSKGRIYIATIPTPRSGLNFNTYQSNAASNCNTFSQLAVGYPVNQTDGNSIQGLSTCQSFSIQDMLQSGSRMISVTPSHATQYEFRTNLDTSNIGWVGSSVSGDSYVGGSTGSISTVGYGYHDPVSLAGGAAVLLYATGLEGGNVFDIDLIYHLEGTPLPNVTGGSNVILAPAALDVCTGSSATPERIISSAKRAGMADQIRVDDSARLSNRAYQYVNQAAQAVSHLAPYAPAARRLASGLTMYMNHRRYREQQRLM